MISAPLDLKQSTRHVNLSLSLSLSLALVSQSTHRKGNRCLEEMQDEIVDLPDERHDTFR